MSIGNQVPAFGKSVAPAFPGSRSLFGLIDPGNAGATLIQLYTNLHGVIAKSLKLLSKLFSGVRQRSALIYAI
jgi:hypothetical protein